MIDGLDPIIHVPKRLAAMAILANAPSATFRFLRDHLRLSESDLSKQMSTLEAAGYVLATKVGHGRGGTTTYRMTAVGEQAYKTHCSALRALLDGAAVPAPEAGSPQ